jgi:hypothetical protein
MKCKRKEIGTRYTVIRLIPNRDIGAVLIAVGNRPT